jgi:hypothetical protein
MSLIEGAGRDPEVNEQLVEEQHRIERERAMEAASRIRYTQPGGSGSSAA